MARRADVLPATSRPLPITHEVLVAHYMPPVPDCEVARLGDMLDFLRAHGADFAGAVQQAEQLVAARRAEVYQAAADANPDGLTAAVRATAAAVADLEARQRELDCVADMQRRLEITRSHTQSFGDPVYRQWAQECVAIRSEWRESMRWVDQMMHDVPREVYAEVRRERLEQGLRGFVLTH